jgi:hypothetical protein
MYWWLERATEWGWLAGRSEEITEVALPVLRAVLALKALSDSTKRRWR